MFGQKPCCFYDLKPYMSLLNGELIEDFLKAMEEIVDLEKGTFPKTVSIIKNLLFNFNLEIFN